jgi:alkylation response protein AidB-like acyl-CoA dehydrogenase
MLSFDLPYFTDEHRSLVALVKEFAEREVDMRVLNDMADQLIPPNATPADLRKRLPFELMSKCHDAGLRQIAAPAEFGGGGYEEDHLAQGAMAEMAGYMGGQFARLLTIAWKQMAAFAYTSKDLAAEVLGDFMNDRTTMMAASFTEPNSGSDMLLPYDEPGAAGQMMAIKDGNDWVLNGDKMFCTAGGVSNYITVMVRTDPKAPISKAMTQFVVPTKTPGWSIIRVNDMMGNELVSNVQMRFDNVRIPDRYRVSEVNGAFEVGKARLAGKSLHIIGEFGWAERMFDDMVAYCKARIQGGKPIIEHNNIGMLLAETDCMMRALRLLLYHDAYDWDRKGEGQMKDVLGWYYINWYSKRVFLQVIECGLEIYGGLGVCKELNFEHFARVILSMFHGGSTGKFSLVKAGKILAKGEYGKPQDADAIYQH